MILILGLFLLSVGVEGQMFGRRGGGGGGPGNKIALPPGMAMLDGEVVDMSNKVVQKAGGSGTQYFSWLNQKGPPLFKRREADTGKKFVVFPDRNYKAGDGHYIVLRRLKRTGMKRNAAIYEAFYLDLGDNIKAMVSQFNSQSFASNRGGGGGGGGKRMKRHTKTEAPET